MKLSAKDIARRIGKAESTFRNYVTCGLFPKPKKNGLSTFWDENVVDAWLILTTNEKATLPSITVDDLLEIQECINNIAKQSELNETKEEFGV